MRAKPLAKVIRDRRQWQRRQVEAHEVVASMHAFDRDERLALRDLDRRKELRRRGDVSQRVAHVD